jgi:hypothetical protein
MTAAAWDAPTPAQGLTFLGRMRRQQRPATPPADPFDPARAGGRAGGYARAALDAECERVMAAAHGTRNHTLNRAAFSLGQLIAGGELDEATVITELTAAARLIGLDDREIGRTIESGLRSGAQQPRNRPEPTTYGRHADQEGTVAGTDEPAPEEAVSRLRRGNFKDLGSRERAQPEYLRLSNGTALLYPGKDSYLYAETESGKSWMVALLVAQCIDDGAPVLVVDFEEGDELEFGTRLVALGVTEEKMSDLSALRYLMVDAPCAAEILAEADDMGALVVINEGMSVAYDVFGLQIKDNDSATAFRRHLVKPHLVAGRAVLTTDHVVKDRDSRGRYAIGGVMKLNAASGGAFLLVNIEGLALGRRGVSNLYVTKDRPGAVKRHAVHAGDKFDPQVKRVGTLVVDDSRTFVNYLDVMILPPAGVDIEEPGQVDLVDVIMATVDRIAAAGRDVNIRAIRAERIGRHSAVEEEIERLVTAGHLIESRGPHGSRLFARKEHPP